MKLLVALVSIRVERENVVDHKRNAKWFCVEGIKYTHSISCFTTLTESYDKKKNS